MSRKGAAFGPAAKWRKQRADEAWEKYRAQQRDREELRRAAQGNPFALARQFWGGT